MLRDLAGKVALVTGAASGIGRGLAEALGAVGMRIIGADVDTEGLTALGTALQAAGVRHMTFPLDIQDRDAWARLIDGAESELGPVQLLCNNAGVTATPQSFLDLPAEAWDWVTGVNLTGTFNGSHIVARRLRELELPGHIVNTASIQGLFAARSFAPYNAAKFGIVGLSETLRIELAEFQIGVSVLCPGPTRGRIMANSAKLKPHLAKPGTAARSGFTAFQSPAEVALQVIDAVRAGRFYVLTHPEYAPVLAARAEALAASLSPADPVRVANITEVEAEVLETYSAIAAAARGPKGSN